MNPSRISTEEILAFLEKNKVYAQKQLGMAAKEFDDEIEKLKQREEELC